MATPKLKLSSRAIDVLWHSCLPPAVLPVQCLRAYCGLWEWAYCAVRCRLWYTSCTSRITSDKRTASSLLLLLLLPPPAAKPNPLSPSRTSSLCLCLRLLVPTFCPSTIRCAPSLIPRFLISSAAPSFSLAPSVPISSSFILFLPSHPAVCKLIQASLLLPLQFALLVLLHT